MRSKSSSVTGKKRWNRCPNCGRRYWIPSERVPVIKPVVCVPCEHLILEIEYYFSRSPEAV